MATRARTTPEERLARRLTSLYEHSGLSFRDLQELVEDALGPAHAVSHEHLRKLHAGILGWGNVHTEVVKALGAIYHKTLRQLSPELADMDELRNFECAPRDSNPEPADLAAPVLVEAFQAGVMAA